MADSEPLPTVAYETLQFHVGGLFDGKTIEELIHLVRKTKRGTPGPTLCGRDRFHKDAPGWSVGGGFSGPWIACAKCDQQRDRDMPVFGMFMDLFPTLVIERLNAMRQAGSLTEVESHDSRYGHG